MNNYSWRKAMLAAGVAAAVASPGSTASAFGDHARVGNAIFIHPDGRGDRPSTARGTRFRQATPG